MKMRFLLPAAIFLSAMLTVRAGPVVNQYFPMNNGDFRTYQDGSYIATEFITQTTYNGHSVFSLNFHDEWDGYPYAQDTWYLGNNGGALALYGITTAWGSLTFNSPANLFTDQTLTNNGSLTSAVTGVDYVAGLGNVTFNITVQTTISSIPGTITVPAGTFANCKLIEVVETATVYGVFQQTYDSAAWVVAPGVGIIEDGVAVWDLNTGQFTSNNGVGGSVDYLELVSGEINNVAIGPSSLPDLTRGTDSLTDRSLHPGDTIIPSITITNEPCSGANANAGAFHVGFYWSTTSSFSGVSPFGEAPIDGCAANGTITLNQRINCFAATVPGTYYLGYKINDENEVAECNTNNNGIFYWTITVTAGPPPLAFKHTGTNFVLSWPTNTTGVLLEYSTNLSSKAWATNSASIYLLNGQYVFTNAISQGSRFYRLLKP
jgi:hypothetical protein